MQDKTKDKLAWGGIFALIISGLIQIAIGLSLLSNLEQTIVTFGGCGQALIGFTCLVFAAWASQPVSFNSDNKSSEGKQ